MIMLLTVTNRTMQHLTGFAILFNKNTFGLAPATPLNINPSLAPNQVLEVSLDMKIDSVGQPSMPLNSAYL